MAEQPKFTAGPWRPYFCGADDTVVLAGNAPIAKMAARTEAGTAELDANTLLIAAAPDLYEELRNARETLELELGMSADILTRIDAVLAKAEGK